jgi:hypothetical protein
MPHCIRLAFVLAATAVGVGHAAAQHRTYPTPHSFEPGDYTDPYYGRQGNQICRRWCLEDRNPCDPPQYKSADGRCSLNRR